MAAIVSAAIALVYALGRDPTLTHVTAATLGGIAAGFALLAIASRRGRPAWIPFPLIALAIAAAVPAYFFGPNSGFTLIIALALVFLGLLSRPERGRSYRISEWAVFAAVVGSQAAVFFLVLGRVLDDKSLVVVIVEGHPDWHHALAHLSLQSIYLCAFFVGRAARRRYIALELELEVALGAAANREALLAHARSEYERALAHARTGQAAVPTSGVGSSSGSEYDSTDTGGTSLIVPDQVGARAVVAVGLDPTPETEPSVEQPKEPIEPAADPNPEAVWRRAFVEKMKIQLIGISVICIGGAALFALIIRDPVAKALALIGFGGIVITAWIHGRLMKTRPELYWPWSVITLLSIGPAFAIGFNTGFAAAVGVLLFSGGVFRVGIRPSILNRRITVLIAACGGTALVAFGVLAGLIPDLSNVTAQQPGAPLYEAVTMHILLVAFYAVAFASSRVVDRSYERIADRLRVTAKEAVAQEELLSLARADIERLIAMPNKGLFTSEKIAGYQVGELLGRGGMGEVYSAEGEDGSVVALKVLRLERVADPTYLEQFEREAEVLSKIFSPHVASVLDSGSAESGLPFMAMQFVRGEVLSDTLSGNRTLPAERARTMVADIGAGLADVHRAGVVHRDVKPQNIVFTGADVSGWKLVDFGIATLVGDHHSGKILGTPRYMSPEQAAGERLDYRSDLYSLCLVIYRALTGASALSGDRPSEVTRARREVGIVRPDVSPDLLLALRIGLARDRDDRFENAEELRDVFEDAFAGHLSESVRRRGRALLEREPFATKDAPARDNTDPSPGSTLESR